jgi:alpha-glucosidase
MIDTAPPAKQAYQPMNATHRSSHQRQNLLSIRTGPIHLFGIIALTAATRLLYAAETNTGTPRFRLDSTVASPNGGMVFLLEHDTARETLAWSVTCNGQPVVTRGALGLELDDPLLIGNQGPATLKDQRSVNTSWRPPYGERSEIPDHFNEATFALAPANQHSPKVSLQVRAYDEGVAFRYLLSGAGSRTIQSEKTSFPLPADTAAWTSRSAQGKTTRQPVSAIEGDVERPLTAELAPDLFVALGEAALVDQARMKFRLAGGSTLQASLAGPQTFTNAFTTAWRYVRAAKSPGALLEGNYFMLNLNEPSRLADASWLRPGKVLREGTLTTQGALACIDYAAAHQLQFIMFDGGWYGPVRNPASDATTATVDPDRSTGQLDLPKVIAAAKSKGIGVILYVNRPALERQLDEIVPLYAQWGVAGIKFGFVQVGSQHWTAWLHDAIAKCAEHHLMVDVHDEYRMTGVERTLPNFMTAEGVRGDETTPENEEVLNTLFTRGLAGAADHTVCYFAPRVNAMGSHASQLAKLVCIYSPWHSVFWYDRPPGAGAVRSSNGSVIQDVPEISFFERVPTVWDATRVLEGSPGRHAVVARRSGSVWFIGALNGAEPREFKIPLDFLDAGKQYRLELFTDDPAVNTPTHVRIETNVVDSKVVIERRVAARNGLAAILTPEPAGARIRDGRIRKSVEPGILGAAGPLSPFSFEAP